MKSGEDATRRLAEADSSRGLQDPADVRRRKEGLLGEKERAVPTAGVNVLHDDALAQNLMAQAQKMQAEANSLTHPESCPDSLQPELKACAVQLLVVKNSLNSEFVHSEKQQLLV
jgi:hypothetical protein